MTDTVTSLFIDSQPAKANPTWFIDVNCFMIAYTVSQYMLWQMLLRVLEGGRTSLLRNALYDYPSARFDIVFHGSWAETNSNLR